MELEAASAARTAHDCLLCAAFVLSIKFSFLCFLCLVCVGFCLRGVGESERE